MRRNATLGFASCCELGFEHFDALDSLGKSSFILGSELWEEHFDSLLALVNLRHY